ncbi:MFS transporter [Amycolatopsis sp. VS8301801F10]|uniref:MFS transporter n=1 Tax=Amycolatopsis sp. VS8301801F10 TaxID=2652442 RepID=UPI0038FC2B66
MRKWWPLVGVCLGTFMLLLDLTILSVALPSVAVGLHTTLAGLQWVLDIYALALAALVLVGGSVADIVGRRRVYLYGLAVFAVASLACGLSTSVVFLVTARAVQGIGAAAMYATTIALLADHYTGRDRGTAFGVWGAVNGVAGAAGPLVGGLITEYLNWRWIFGVNIPICLVAVLITLRCLHETEKRAQRKFDIPGMVSFAVAATAIVYGLILVNGTGWTDPSTLLVFAAAVVALVVFVIVELRAESPFIDLRLLRSKAFNMIMVATLVLQVAAFTYMPFTSLWIQSVLGAGPMQGGLVFAAQGGGALVASLLAGRFLHGVAPRWSVGFGVLIVGCGALLQAGIGADADSSAVILGLAVSGIGIGLGTPTLVSAAVAAVPPKDAGMAGGAVNTLRQFGYALGVAVLGLIFASAVQSSFESSHSVADPHAAAEKLASGGAGELLAANRGLTGAVQHAFVSGLNTICLVAGLLGVVGGLLVLVFGAVRTKDDKAVPEPVKTT